MAHTLEVKIERMRAALTRDHRRFNAAFERSPFITEEDRNVMTLIGNILLERALQLSVLEALARKRSSGNPGVNVVNVRKSI